jgi:hypothetical protein
MEKEFATVYNELKDVCTEKGIKITTDFNINPLDDNDLKNFLPISNVSVKEHLTNGDMDICWGIEFDKNIGKAVFDNMGENKYDYYDKGVYGTVDKGNTPKENTEKVISIIKDLTLAIKYI